MAVFMTFSRPCCGPAVAGEAAAAPAVPSAAPFPAVAGWSVPPSNDRLVPFAGSPAGAAAGVTVVALAARRSRTRSRPCASHLIMRSAKLTASCRFSRGQLEGWTSIY